MTKQERANQRRQAKRVADTINASQRIPFKAK